MLVDGSSFTVVALLMSAAFSAIICRTLNKRMYNLPWVADLVVCGVLTLVIFSVIMMVSLG